MFTEDQVNAILGFDGVNEKVEKLKLEFKESEVQLLDMINHDFLSMALLTPTIEMALANGSISLMEEMAINQKARKLSKGGYFLQTDPVVYTMKFYINNFNEWREKFYNLLTQVIKLTCDLGKLNVIQDHNEKIPEFEFEKNLLHAPYIFAQYMSTFFINDIEQTTIQKKISQIEYEKILEIGNKLKIDHFVIFKGFCQTFSLK